MNFDSEYNNLCNNLFNIGKEVAEKKLLLEGEEANYQLDKLELKAKMIDLANGDLKKIGATESLRDDAFNRAILKDSKCEESRIALADAHFNYELARLKYRVEEYMIKFYLKGE